jgi:hypothetical protein
MFSPQSNRAARSGSRATSLAAVSGRLRSPAFGGMLEGHCIGKLPDD